MKDFFVSVIIPVKETSYYVIFENLPQLDRQTYRNFEVILLPNQHSQYDLELLKKYKWLRIIPTGKITRPAQKRNKGVEESKGDIIAFIDDDAYPTPEWLEKAVEMYKEKDVSSVCGPGVLPKKVNIWEKVFDEVLKTPIGAGGLSYRFVPEKERYVDDYPSMNLFIKKEHFVKLGGFNNDYWPGEDSKLCEDLVYKLKEKIFYHPQVLIYHHRRNNLGGYLRQHGQYGFHRGAFFAHGDKNSRRFAYLIPTFFVLYIALYIASLILNFLHPLGIFLYIFSVPLYTYFLACLFLFLKAVFNTKSLAVGILSVIVLVLMHFHYGILFVKGYIKGLTSKESIYD